MTFELSIMTPERQFFSGQVEALTVTGIDGQMTVLPGMPPWLFLWISGKFPSSRMEHGGRLSIQRALWKCWAIVLSCSYRPVNGRRILMCAVQRRQSTVQRSASASARAFWRVRHPKLRWQGQWCACVQRTDIAKTKKEQVFCSFFVLANVEQCCSTKKRSETGAKGI